MVMEYQLDNLDQVKLLQREKNTGHKSKRASTTTTTTTITAAIITIFIIIITSH